jgi:regulator of protease activity HflC (stomatin/prohibitin superfamily)
MADRTPTARSFPVGGVAAFVGLAFVVLVGAVVLLNWVIAFHSVGPGVVCVVQEGGPFDGRDVAKVRQAAGGVENIGIFNHQRCFPSTERNYIISADPREADAKTVDFVEIPTADAVNVRIEGQALFRLNTDPKVVADLYRKFGVRTFDGLHPYDGDEGWRNFLAIQFRPILDNALREAIGTYKCVQLNNTCQYVQNAEEAVRGEVQVVNTGQTLTEAQEAIAATLQTDLDDTLGGHYFEGIKFRLRGVKFDPQVQEKITAAQAARTELATAKLEAQRRVEQAVGDRRVAEQKALAIKATQNAYRGNPSQARIDAIKSLPAGLQALGGNLSSVVGTQP